jgi:hypothetical protein
MEIKDLKEFLGVDADNIDSFKEAFNKKYVPTETHSKTLGEINGKVTHEIKKAFKGIGVEVTSDELKDKSLTEIPALVSEKVKARFEELESATKLTKEQIEEKVGKDLSKYKQQLADLTTIHETTKHEYESFKQNVETEKRNFVINSKKSSVIGGLKFSEAANEFSRKGWEVSLNEKYAFDIDGENYVVRDAKGNIVPSTIKAGEAATYEEIIEKEFKQSGLGAVVNPNKVTTFVTPTVQQPANGRKLAPRH